MFQLSFGGAIGSGSGGRDVSLSDLHDLEPLLRNAEEWLREGASRGKEGFGWVDLPYQDIDRIVECGNWLGQFDHIVQIGIGGSALGNLMLKNALLHPYYNEISREKRKGPTFHVSDNVDPVGNLSILDVTDLSRTAIVVVSKSGSTAETMANFLFFYDRLEKELGASLASEHVLVITDEKKGNLRAFAEETGCRNLTIPSGVGGRYSVLSAVGLASASATGIDIGELLSGASAMDEKLHSDKGCLTNPAWVLAALHYLHSTKGRNMDVLMPYSDRLEDFVEWYAQLCAESLGKEGKGYTPLRALGAIDQHSQVQLYTQGPDDKLFTILDVADSPELVIPEVPRSSLDALSYLHGKNMAEMLSYEARATASAILRSGKPVLWVQMKDISPKTLGALIYLFEYVVALTGYLLDINPFDQPGVEQGKHYTYGFMGREGFEENKQQAEELFQIISKNSVSM